MQARGVMKERYILNDLSKKILHIGLAVVTLAFFFVMLHIWNAGENGVIIMSEVYTMTEHIGMSLFLVVAVPLVLDIHIKTKK